MSAHSTIELTTLIGGSFEAKVEQMAYEAMDLRTTRLQNKRQSMKMCKTHSTPQGIYFRA